MSEERTSVNGWMVPTLATLKKYGLSEEDWRAILREQDYVCPVCTNVPSTGRGVIDHEHVKGWKNMPPEKRKRYVRGVVCWWCNHAYLGRSITATKAHNAYEFLARYETAMNRGKVPWWGWEDR